MDPMNLRGLTMQLGNATLVAGTTTTISLSVATSFAINGKLYAHAIASNHATPTTDAATGLGFIGCKANQGTVYVLGLNAAGDLLAVQGEVVALDAAGAFVNAPEFPASIPDTFCPIGYYLIKAGSTADAVTGWKLGSSNSAAVTGITYTLVDCATLPARPQTT